MLHTNKERENIKIVLTDLMKLIQAHSSETLIVKKTIWNIGEAENKGEQRGDCTPAPRVIAVTIRYSVFMINYYLFT